MVNMLFDTTKAVKLFVEHKVVRPVLLKVGDACYSISNHTDWRGINPQVTFDSPMAADLNLENSTFARLKYLSRLKKHYLPLYIHGENCVGKTVMLQCMANEVKKCYPLRRVAYLKASEFCDEIVAALKKGKNARETIIRRYGNFEALFIDDVQYLATRISTAELVMDIIDEYVKNEKMLVFAGDTPPSELPVTGRLKKHLTVVGVIELKRAE